MLIIRPRVLLLFLAALLQLKPGAPAAAQDGDVDGISDEQDNCLVKANPTQLDTNLDGYGNWCDTDYNNDGVCGPSDFTAFKAAYFSSVGQPNYNADIDVEGDGAVGPTDFTVFKQHYMLPVSPSGLGCAGAIPCTCDAPELESVEEVQPWDVELSWTAAAGSRFEIERRPAGGTWTTIASPSASESSWVDSSRPPGSYEYRMRADCSNGSGNPQWSEYSPAGRLELSVECDSQTTLGAGLPIPPVLPCTGLPEYQAVSALPVPGGTLNLAGGNLLVAGDGAPLETRLGSFGINLVYSAAWGDWIWSFDLSYDGSVFVDDTLAIHDVSSLTNGAAIPGTHWVKVDADSMQTKGGLVYDFGAGGLLEAIHWSSSEYPRIAFSRSPHATEPGLTVLGLNQERFPGDTSEGLTGWNYDAQHHVVQEPGGGPTLIEYDPSGRLVSFRDYFDFVNGKPGFRYEYSGTLLTAIITSEGERIEYSYDANRRVTEIRQIGGPNPVHTFSYSGPDPVTGLYQTTYTDPLGNATRFRYDHRRRLREVESVETGELAVREWQGKRVTKLVQPDDVTTEWTISNDDVASETSASGNVTTITYQASGVNRINPRQRAVFRIEDSIGLVEQRQYDAQGRLLSIANGESETTMFTYDSGEMLASVTDAGGVTTSFSEYGQHGKPSIVQTGDWSCPIPVDSLITQLS